MRKNGLVVASLLLATMLASAEPADYVRNLQRKYGARLTYDSPAARKAVEEFNIDCRSPDGRYMPLANLLLARLAEASAPSIWEVTRVAERGGEVRIYDHLEGPNGPQTAPELSFETNKWGELRPTRGTIEPFLNACMMKPIYELPRR